LQIGIRSARLGRSSLTFDLGIWRDGELLTSGEIVYVHADSATRSSAPLPQWLREKIVSFERTPPQH
jgi:acyl-CoA thioester hydrolase